MAKAKKVLSTVLAALMVVFTVAGYVPAKAAVVPQIKIVEQPQAEYKVGERMYTKVQCANFSGKVEYRATLWDGSEKKTIEVWKTYPYYYKNWQPTGKTVFPITWIVEKPGVYNLTVYVRPVGSKVPYSTYAKSANFTVKSADVTVDSIAPVADVTVNEGEKVTLPEKVTLNMSDKTTKEAKVTWAAVDTTKVGEATVEGTVEGTDKKATVKVVVKAVDLKVESVSANNLKEVTVVFNKAVDKALATNVTNYRINDAILPLSTSAKLLEDGKTVVINLRDFMTLINQKNYKLGVNIDKLSTIVDFTPLDVTVPTVKSVEALGTKKINITFSEPVNPDTALTRVNYQINGYIINGELSQNKDKNVVTISLYSPLKAGENKMTVTGVKDFAAMTVVNYLNQAFSVVDDSTAPTSFTVDSATLEYVDVTFNEAVDPNTVDVANIYWSDNAGTTKHYATDAYPLDAAYTKYEFDFTGDRLPAKSTTLYVENVCDMSENEVAKLTSVVTASVDTERPDVTSVDFKKDPNTGLYVVGNNILEVKFNKAIELDQFTGDNVTNLMVKDSNGKVVAVTGNAEYKTVNGIPYKDTMWITLTSSLADEKTYTVEIANVVDNTALQNKMIPEKFTLVGLAQTAPSVDKIFVYTDINNSTKIQVVYTNSMAISGDKSILDNNKYMMEIGGKWYPIPSSASFEPSYNNMAVIITIPAEAKYDTANYVKNATLDKIKVTYVADKNGNMLDGYTAETTPSVNSGAAMLTNTDADYYPYASAKDTIVVTFDRPLQYVNYRDFEVKAGGTSYTVSRATYQTVEGKGVVTLKISTPLPENPATVGVTVNTNSTVTSIDILGNTIAAKSTCGTIIDEIAPSLIATNPVVATAKNTIVVYTNEPLQAASGDVSASFVVTYGYNNKALTPGSDYIARVNGNNVEITLNASLSNLVNLKVATNNAIKLVFDDNGNIASSNALSFTAKTVKDMDKIDTKVPVVTGVVNGITNKDVTPVFTEGTATLDAVAFTSGKVVSAEGPHILVVTDAAGNATTINFTIDKTAPTVTTKLPAAGDFIADATQTLVFSEDLDAASKTAVKAAVDAKYVVAGTATVSSVWTDAKTLTITIKATDTTNKVTLGTVAPMNVKDIAGNAATALALQ